MTELSELVAELIEARRVEDLAKERKRTITAQLCDLIGKPGRSSRVVTADGELIDVTMTQRRGNRTVDATIVAKVCPPSIVDVVCPRRVDLAEFDAAIEHGWITADDVAHAVDRGPTTYGITLKPARPKR